MERLGAEIEKQLSRFGAQDGMREIVAAWPAAVGEMVAANAWPARLARDGTLHVNTSSSTWAFELGQLAPVMLRRLRDTLGESGPSRLRFSAGHLPEPPLAGAEDVHAVVPDPDEEVLQRAAEVTAQIEDEELRERVARAVALGLAKLPADLSF